MAPAAPRAFGCGVVVACLAWRSILTLLGAKCQDATEACPSGLLAGRTLGREVCLSSVGSLWQRSATVRTRPWSTTMAAHRLITCLACSMGKRARRPARTPRAQQCRRLHHHYHHRHLHRLLLHPSSNARLLHHRQNRFRRGRHHYLRDRLQVRHHRLADLCGGALAYSS